MAPNIKNQLNQKFSFTTGSWLNWADEAPTLTQKEESEESQSIDSDHTDDFWHNWNPTIEKMIIARRASFLQNLEEQIANDEAKLPTKPKQTKQKQTKTHTLEKCSCGALLSKNKVAKHLKTRVHQEALDKKTQPPAAPTPPPPTQPTPKPKMTSPLTRITPTTFGTTGTQQLRKWSLLAGLPSYKTSRSQ